MRKNAYSDDKMERNILTKGVYSVIIVMIKWSRTNGKIKRKQKYNCYKVK